MIHTHNDETITEDEAAARAVEHEAAMDIAMFEWDAYIPSDSAGGTSPTSGSPYCRMLAPVSGIGFGIPCYGDTQQEADAFARAMLGRLGL